MSSRRSPSFDIDELRARIVQLSAEVAETTLSAVQRRRLERQVRELTDELGRLLRELDPISEPAALFDPRDPKIVGRFAALALVAQSRSPFSSVPKTYGSGIYSIYYIGSFEPYAPISGTETPIYVGTASPAVPNARTPSEQGAKLSERIAYHGRNIARASSTLAIDDFEFRSLVVQSGWEKQAESYLIHLFHPVWNKETQIVSGFGKHGDSATMRQHGRSPWDTLHPARAWAGESQSDQKSEEQIKSELADHFAANPPYVDVNAVLTDFFEELKQTV